MKNGNSDQKVSCNLHPNMLNAKTEMECTKLAFEQFLKSRKDTPQKSDSILSQTVHTNDSLLSKSVQQSETLLNQTVHNLIKIKKDIFCQTNDEDTAAAFDRTFKPASPT